MITSYTLSPVVDSDFIRIDRNNGFVYTRTPDRSLEYNEYRLAAEPGDKWTYPIINDLVEHVGWIRQVFRPSVDANHTIRMLLLEQMGANLWSLAKASVL